MTFDMRAGALSAYRRTSPANGRFQVFLRKPHWQVLCSVWTGSPLAYARPFNSSAWSAPWAAPGAAAMDDVAARRALTWILGLGLLARLGPSGWPARPRHVDEQYHATLAEPRGRSGFAWGPASYVDRLPFCPWFLAAVT